MPQHLRALLLRRVPGADGDTQLGPQTGERPAQVPLDVVVRRLERRDVEQPQSLARLGAEPVDSVQECCECLPGAGRRLDQGVLAARDRRPAALLRGCRAAERVLEPGPSGRRKDVQGAHTTRVLVKIRRMTYAVSGSYFESCNCDPICPCRMADGIPGGRSTHGECLGALSWLVENGRVGDVDVTGLSVALVVRYSDDELGSPWTIVLHVDADGDEQQRAALSDVFLGRLGGPQV